MARSNFTTPVGRIVMGSLYKPQDKDADGKPLVIKSGPNAGQPKVQYFFAVAIPKGQEQHWAQTEWGKVIWGAGHTAFPREAQSEHFAWKIVDGDSNKPNRKGVKPCDRIGYKGHWVLSFTSGYAPKIYNRDGSQMIVEPDAVKPGYYVQVNADVDGNSSTQNPGVFLNHNMVALSAYGEEIVVGPDASSVGFGTAPLPAGAMATPPAGFAPQAPQPAPVAPAMPAMPAAPVAVAPAVTPNPAFLQVPGGPAPVIGVPVPPVPAAPAAPPAAPVRQMTPAAQAPYEAYIAQGWTDALLVQHGLMVP